MNILVSACLLGLPCRYDGSSKPREDVLALAGKHVLIPVCPEQLGGLPTPRPPAEWQGERIVNRAGTDVTEAYLRGAEGAVRIARLCGCTHAILKERSPACSCAGIYDGSFSGVLVPGRGSAARALEAAGITVLGETMLADLPEQGAGSG